MTMTVNIPEAVREVASTIDRGAAPHRMNPPLEDRDDWTKTAACGEPHYVHIPSGWVIVKGRRGKTAILSPGQMQSTPTLMVSYFRVMNDQRAPFAKVDDSRWRQIATRPEDNDNGHGFDYPLLMEMLDAALGGNTADITEEERRALESLVDKFGP